jgi:CRISP-associated protein Cas1
MKPNFERVAQLLQFTLRFTSPVNLHFFHHPAMYAAIMDRLGNPKTFPKGVWLYCPERGRVHYRPGEPYRFGLALTPGAALSPGRIVRLLKSPPVTAFGKAQGAPFGDNFRVEQVLDVVTGSPLRGDAAWLDMASLQPGATALSKEEEITLTWLSPLLIHRTPLNSRQFVMDGDVFDPEKLMDWVARTVRECWPDVAIPESADVRVVENHMIRADVSYPKKRLLGAAGSVRLEFKGSVGDWALPLLLSGIAGVGKARNMGQGRFAVEKFPIHPSWPPLPAKTLLERAAEPENLERVLEAMQGAGPSPGVDDVGLEEFQDALTVTLPKLTSSLCKGKIEPDPLRGLIIRNKKEDGKEKLRPLAIPTMRDRFLQRAVLEELTPAAEMLFEDASFAYRKGLSYKTARQHVAMARRDGFTHVLDADIRAFFDCVDWSKLQDRIAGFFGDDPVVDALMAWVKAPVSFEGCLVERDRGLPQGSVVSPLLANLYLDVLDRVVIGAINRGRITRDDFQKNEKGPYKIRILTEPLKLLIREFERQLAREVSDAGGRKDSFRGHLYRQVLSMGRLVDGREDRFFAFRMKW